MGNGKSRMWKIKLRELLVFYLYCFNIGVPLFSFTFFFLFRPGGLLSGLERHNTIVSNNLVLITFTLCCVVAVTSIIVFVFGNNRQKIGSIIPWILAIGYVSLWIHLYYTLV